MAEQNQDLTTRQRILAYLAKHHSASAQSLGRLWGLTPADIRYHLKELLREGYIERVMPFFGGAARAGRPEQYYRLPVESTPDNLAALCGVLLSTLLSTDVENAEGGSRLQSAARHMIETELPDPATEVADSPIRRLGTAVDSLNRWNYQARWEASASGPKIMLHNCPYSAVISAHPEVCLFDRFLLEKLTGIPLKQTARLNALTGRPPACVFSTSGQEVQIASQPAPGRLRS